MRPIQFLLAVPRSKTAAPDTLLAKLVCWGIRQDDPARAKRFLQLVWRRYFGEGQGIALLDDLVHAAAEIGLSGQDMEIAAARADAVRNRMQAMQTQLPAGVLACRGSSSVRSPFLAKIGSHISPHILGMLRRTCDEGRCIHSSHNLSRQVPVRLDLRSVSHLRTAVLPGREEASHS